MTEEKFTVLFESQFSVGSNELVFQVKVRCRFSQPPWVTQKVEDLPEATWLVWESQRALNPHTVTDHLAREAVRKPAFTLEVPAC